MKNKTSKILLILLATIVLCLIFAVQANAATDKTLTVSYGDTRTSIKIDDSIDTNGRANGGNQYTIQDLEGTSILAVIPGNGMNATHFYGYVSLDASELGMQTMKVTFKPGNANPANETNLTVYCAASENFKTVVEALGAKMDNLYTLDTTGVYANLNALEASKYEAILDAQTAYASLNATEKAKVDEIAATIADCSDFADVVTRATNGLNAIAELFVSDSKLAEQTLEVYEDALNMQNRFNALTKTAKEMVLRKLGTVLNDSFANGEELFDGIQLRIDNIKANSLLEKLADLDNFVLEADDETIVALEGEYNNLTERAKEILNGYMLPWALQEDEENADKTYPELLSDAIDRLNQKAADEFIANYLTTEDGKVIVEANNNNFQMILDAEEAYKGLSDASRELVNVFLAKEGDTTYPVLLADAQKLAPTPKTGDLSVIVGSVLLVSLMGIVVTVKKRK